MTVAGRRSQRWLALAIFSYGMIVAGLVAFVVYRRQGVVGTIVDLNGFGNIARRLANGEGFSQGHGATTRRGPLYPILGAAALTLFGREGSGIPQAELFRPMIVTNCLFFGFTCVVVWALARRVFDPRIALLAAVICPLVPQSIRYVGMTEVETLMGLCVALLALTGLALVKDPGLRTGIGFGATAAAATLAKPVALLYPFVFLASAALYWKATGTQRRPAIVGSCAALACFVALLLPWSIRNMAVTHGQFKGISSNGPGEFLRGYVNAQPKYYLLRQDFGGPGNGEKWDPEANLFEENLLRPYGIPFYWSSGSNDTVPPHPAGVADAMLEVEKDRVETIEVKRRVLHDPSGFVQKFFVQLFMFWYVVETRTRALFVGSVALVTLVLCGFGLLHARRSGTMVWPVVMVLAYFNVIYAVFLAFARYSMPLFPTLVVLAAGGLMSLGERLPKRVRLAGLRSESR
jgi:4-amino-4-deoxy-L-arabinose transferase-like glycosyltransferase